MTALVLALLLQVTSSVQVPRDQVPPRDGSVPAQKGTAQIRGRVVAADTAKPIRRARIGVSAPELTEARSVTTNADGVFTVRELPAGRYTITAGRSGFMRIQYGQRRPGESGRPLQVSDGERLDNVNFTLPRMGLITGRVTDEVGEPLANVYVFRMETRYFRGKRRLVPAGGGFLQTDDAGQYRMLNVEPGEYTVMGVSRETWTAEDDEKQMIGFVPTYFGGMTSPGEAGRIKVALGQEVSGIDFSMVPGRLSSISGTAVRSDGTPLGGEQIGLQQEYAGPNGMSSFGFPGGRINADGTFTIKNLPAGDYKLTVRAPGDKDRKVEVAAMTVSVAGANVDGVALVTGTGGAISGRVITDTGAAPTFKEVAKLRVGARAVDTTNTYSSYSEDNGRVRDDWTFELADVTGAQRLSIAPLPSGWAIRSIEYEGRDLADVPIDIAPGQRIDNVTVVVSNRLPSVTGTLLDDRLRPAEGTVLLFPTDDTRWGENARLVRTSRPDQTGAFVVRQVVPGEYYVVPVEYVREGDWSDPAYLESLKERAKTVTVTDTGVTGVALTLKRGG